MEYLQQHGIIHNTFSLSDPRFKLLSKFETKYQIKSYLSIIVHIEYICTCFMPETCDNMMECDWHVLVKVPAWV